jgi:peptidoglycan hydrolase CwlO-like protein
MEKRILIVTDIKTGLATISGYHPDSYSTQILISGVNKNVDKLIEDHKAVVETLTKKFESQREQTHKNFQYVDQKNHQINKLNYEKEQLQNKIEELEKLNKYMVNCENCKTMEEARKNKRIPKCKNCKNYSNWTAKGIK